MTHLCDSGALEALTPDDSGILREWASKYAVITDAQTAEAALAIYSSPDEADEPEVVITLNGSDIQISKQPEFEQCFTVTTSKGLRIFLRAASIVERDSWVASLRHAKKAETSRTKEDTKMSTKRSQSDRALENQAEIRACGHVFLWDEAGQKWVNRYFYLSAGFLNEFSKDFQAPIVSHDLTRDCAIRMRGTPACVEVRLGTGEMLRFFGRTDTETKQWLQAIKLRATEPPQPFLDFAKAAEDASHFENDGGALSFYVKPDIIGDLMAGVPSSFAIMGSIASAAAFQNEFSAFLTAADSEKAIKAQGTFHLLSGNKLSLRIVHHQQGHYPLHVQFRGKDVFGSPFMLVIHPAPPSPQHSLVTGQGMFHAPLPGSGKLAKFAVRLRDRYLNFCERVDPAQLQVTMFGPAMITQMVYVGDGTTEITYKTTSAAQEIQIEVTYAGTPIAGSPFIPSFESSSNDEQRFSHTDDLNGGMMIINERMQAQNLAIVDPEQRAAEEAIAREMQAVQTTRQVTEKAEAVSAYISARIRQDWAESNQQVDDVFPKEEQLGLLLASSSLRANGDADEPAFLRKLAVAVETERGYVKKWEAEPLPPPWASMSVVQAYVRRQRRDLQEAIQPLVEATKAEQAQAKRLEPVSNWKRLLLDWPGPEKVSLETLEKFKTAVSVSPLNHRQLIVAMCDSVLRAEEDFARRKALKQNAGEGAIEWTGRDDDEEEEESSSRLGSKAFSGLNHREELRKRVQSVSLGRSLQRPAEPILLASEPQVKEKTLGDHIERLHREEPDEREEEAEERNGVSTFQSEEQQLRRHGSSSSDRSGLSTGERSTTPITFEIGDRVKVDGVRAGTVRHVGPTRFARGLWIGVELDEAVGKNSGTVEGVQYFACAPDYGLFVRPERVVVMRSSPPSRMEEGGVRLAPGSLANIDPRDLISALRSRRESQTGNLTRNAFVEAFQSVEPRVSEREASELFDAFDRDGSGTLDAREFIPGSLVLCGGDKGEKMQLSFQLLDFDQTGFLERDEVENYVVAVFRIVKHAYPQVFASNNITPEALAEESVNSALQSADQDKDGRISLEEFKAWMQSMAGSSTFGNGATDANNFTRRGNPTVTVSTRVEERSEYNAAPSPIRPPAVPSSRSSAERTPNNTFQSPANAELAGRTDDKHEKGWTEVQRWLVDEALVVLPYEQKAVFDQFKEHGLTSLVRVARLTPSDINRLNLSFDLRLRLITHVRALAKTLVFEASERKLHLSPLASPQQY